MTKHFVNRYWLLNC